MVGGWYVLALWLGRRASPSSQCYNDTDLCGSNIPSQEIPAGQGPILSELEVGLGIAPLLILPMKVTLLTCILEQSPSTVSIPLSKGARLGILAR